MKIEKKELENKVLRIILNVAAADYAELEKKRTSEVRRNADFKGFRKGNVPVSLIKKMYGEQILGEAVNQTVGEALEEYLKKGKYNILGEPLAAEDQEDAVWESGNDFCFKFDVALRPEINLEPAGTDEITQYNISASAKEKKEMAENMKKYYEEQKKADEKAEVKTDEEIEKEVAERLDSQLKSEADWRLNKDIRDYFVNKAGITLPADFLKRWLFEANKGKFSKEDIEKDYSNFESDFKWQLIRSYLMEKYGFKIEDKDLEEAARSYVSYQYAMYGLSGVPQELINEAAANLLKDQNQIGRLLESVEDQKVLEKLRSTVTLKAKKITSEKFRELK